MNQNITDLYYIAQKPVRHIIGLMSGTSLDGLDVALCRIEGSGSDTKVELVAFKTVDYDEAVKNKIRSVFAKQTIDFQHLVLLNEWIGTLHGNMINECLESWNIKSETVDVVASHGQTVYHAPQRQHGLADYGNATLQIGDGDHVAVSTGIITVSDFRQKHIAAGGEGAPLAVYGDYLMFSKQGEDRIMLNMGGIGNFTYLPADCDANKVFVSDSGPGNTLMDAFVQKHFKKSYDQDAALAKSGKVSQALLLGLLDHPFFGLSFPKTTGPEVFNLEYLAKAQKMSKTEKLSSVDVLATLNKFSAITIASAIGSVIEDKPFQVYVSGGGAHNLLLMSSLQEYLPNCNFQKMSVLGINGDAKEAVLFAILANEALCGGNTNFGDRGGVPSVSMGKISFPR
jgi:anhydro-N-acetylmuramic acid kinase